MSDKESLESAMAEGCLPGRVILFFDDEERDHGAVVDRESGLYLPRPKKVKNQARVVAIGNPVDTEDERFLDVVKRGDEVFAYRGYGKEFEVEFGDETLTYYVYLFHEIFFRFPRVNGNR